MKNKTAPAPEKQDLASYLFHQGTNYRSWNTWALTEMAITMCCVWA